MNKPTLDLNKNTLDLRHLIRRCPDCSRRFSNVAMFCPFDGTTLVDAERPDDTLDALLGKTVDGRYAIESIVGEGGMGTVYCARHVALARSLAVKVLRADLAQDAELAARFLQEAQATAAIKHPNVVSITDFGRLADQRPYYVMELLTGRTLASLIKTKSPIELRTAAQVATGIAEGLQAAHTAGVIHRDLKPENVFLVNDEGHELRIVDFGAALIVGASRLTRQGIVFGTPHYMSPEQASGKPVDHRADIYALGVILYEMITGSVPFQGDTYMGVLTQHMFVAPRPPSQAVPELDGKLGAMEAVVLRALEKDPIARFPTMHHFADAITAALASGVAPSSFRPSRPMPRPDVDLPTLGEIRDRVSNVDGLDRRRQSRMVALGVAAALVVLVGVVMVGVRIRAASGTTEVDAGALVAPSAHATPTVAAQSAVPPIPAVVTATQSATVPPPPSSTAQSHAPPPPKIPRPPAQTARPPTSTLGPDPFQ